MSTSSEPIIAPFTVIVDNSEQHPFSFRNFRSDAHKKFRPLVVPIVVRSLDTGDYSIEGLEHLVTVERKSLQDLYGTLGQQRDRFERELVRMSEMDFGAVVIEASWGTILAKPPPHSNLLPKTVFRSVLAWQQRFPNVHWWACDTRWFAEQTTFRILERYYRDLKEGLKDVQPAGNGQTGQVG